METQKIYRSQNKRNLLATPFFPLPSFRSIIFKRKAELFLFSHSIKCTSPAPEQFGAVSRTRFWQENNAERVRETPKELLKQVTSRGTRGSAFDTNVKGRCLLCRISVTLQSKSFRHVSSSDYGVRAAVDERPER